ncbi:aminotransferase class V-fold PLP-dependent enzyme [Xanthomonas translucens]|uniref:aminotransferase class V-fold PLP-dependent enzyme n=3 Tax=Xanthomonas campestris pv. translucens TaxID=343 RepID=UPI0002A79A13|nr:aminotransferase class V-fold PLP-dependent enzyme [Xanthomonas translucens]AVY65246.1 penicillin epimerase [Xanthomonas translucens pv. undulosa]ELQ17190.1 aminotransferase [Xanthomonas translucens DAR61454]MBC3970939.1 aminotransferase class V-fold PLP-dependent enzyme [Xanthomonas translucens pv. undulosa]MCT8281885.1 aminotransferase class V-fold PLP-dependent enzyme [Xanthomonas translucens pv. undulosa]MCT8316576.1 aminotransferase class V-fold PLP-dependent enzyme [Xanthomonas transl
MRNFDCASDRPDPRRRALLAAAPLLSMQDMLRQVGGSATQAAEMPAAPAGVPARQLASDEAYWAQVAAAYDVDRRTIALENGYWGALSQPVLQAYVQRVQQVNHDNAHYARLQFPDDYRALRARAAGVLGIDPRELALTRNATESLQLLIGGYNRLKPGDAVLYADLDYDAMITAMQWLRQRRGVEAIGIELPQPATRQNLIDAYAQALQRYPQVKMMLVTCISHRTGLVLPVAEIVAMARQRGVDCIVDATQAIGQRDLRLPELGADFVGFNFHKWIGAPLGVGGFHIRRERIGDIDPHMGQAGPADSIDTRVHTGTVDFAAFLTLPTALEAHERIGAANKQARLQYLRDRWVHAIADLPQLEVLTPDDPQLYGAMTSLRLRGQTSEQQNTALAQRLLQQFGVMTTVRSGAASGACVRATPALFTRPQEIDRFAQALRSIAG